MNELPSGRVAQAHHSDSGKSGMSYEIIPPTGRARFRCSNGRAFRPGSKCVRRSAPGFRYLARMTRRMNVFAFDESYFAGLGVSASTKVRNGPEVLPRCQATKTSQVAPVSATGIITTFGIFR
jgi:hypothetical protein